MMDLRAVTALFLGVAGLTLGVVAALADLPALGLAAGGFAMAAGVLAAVVARTAVVAEGEHDRSDEQIRELEEAVAAQVQARIAAEEAVRNLGDQLASSERNRESSRGLPLDDGGAEGLTDAVTGLFSQEYFLVSLEARIAAARRHLRPVAVALVEVAEGVPAESPQPANPIAVAHGINATLRDSDTACRLRDGRFALVLEDTPENGAIWTIERIRRALTDQYSGITVWAGIACYPAHAFDTDDLVSRADAALDSAREWRQDRIEVATAD